MSVPLHIQGIDAGIKWPAFFSETYFLYPFHMFYSSDKHYLYQQYLSVRSSIESSITLIITNSHLSQLDYVHFFVGEIKFSIRTVKYLKLNGFACKGAFNAAITAASILWKLPSFEYIALLGLVVIRLFHLIAGPLLTQLPLDKMAAISQTIFSDAFCEWKVLYFDFIFSEVCYYIN